LINDGKWHHIVLSYDKTGFAVTYLDGVPIDSRSVAGAGDFDQPSNIWNIGSDTTGTYWFETAAVTTEEAVIDDMGIWRRALSQVEAQQMYTVG
jgi:hypothetical protein